MKALKLFYVSIGFFILALLFIQCQKEELVADENASLVTLSSRPTPELAGNNLSFPVIWSDGFEKVLREPPTFEPFLEGEWWYVWGENPVEPTDPVYSCRPNPNDPSHCLDGSVPGDGVSIIYKAYLQKREENVWKAGNFSHASEPLNVDLIDWGDNLESIDWNLRSQIRTELVLYENLTTPVIEYAMRHVSGWGVDEVHGLQTTLENEVLFGPGTLSTVYSHNMRFTIQKMNVHKDSIAPGELVWQPNLGWTEADPNGEDLIKEPLFNHAVYESTMAGTTFDAEVNVKGKIIYGYTWNVRQMNDGMGYYRITYSFDENGGQVPLNTYFDEFTEIILPLEEGLTPSPRGGEAIIDVGNNLTYMDIRIIKGGGSGGK